MKSKKKKWGNPIVDIQHFEPHEYCANCDVASVTTLPNWSSGRYSYIDLDNDGVYDVGERFELTGVSSRPLGISDQITSQDVGIYYIALSSGQLNNHTLSAGDPYRDHTSGGTNYKVHLIATKKIKIEHSTAFYFTKVSS